MYCAAFVSSPGEGRNFLYGAQEINDLQRTKGVWLARCYRCFAEQCTNLCQDWHTSNTALFDGGAQCWRRL